MLQSVYMMALNIKNEFPLSKRRVSSGRIQRGQLGQVVETAVATVRGVDFVESQQGGGSPC